MTECLLAGSGPVLGYRYAPARQKFHEQAGKSRRKVAESKSRRVDTVASGTPIGRLAFPGGVPEWELLVYTPAVFVRVAGKGLTRYGTWKSA